MLNDTALITVDQYASAIGGISPAADDTALTQAEFYINAASDYFLSATDRTTLLSGSIKVDQFTGLGVDERYDFIHNTYFTKDAPICTTRAPELEYLSGTTWYTVPAANYSINTEEDYLYFNDTRYFSNGRLYRFTYEYGYESRANIPADIQSAIVILAQLTKKATAYVGLSSTAEDSGQAFNFTLPPTVIKTIQRYAR